MRSKAFVVSQIMLIKDKHVSFFRARSVIVRERDIPEEHCKYSLSFLWCRVFGPYRGSKPITDQSVLAKLMLELRSPGMVFGRLTLNGDSNFIVYANNVNLRAWAFTIFWV